MPKKTPRPIIKLMQDLYALKTPIKEIADLTNLSYTIVYTHTRLLERGFASGTDYQNFLAKNNGCKSYADYQQKLFKKNGFENSGKYLKQLVLIKDFSSEKEYRQKFAERQGYQSYAEYQKSKAEERKNNPENQRISCLIKEGLEETGKNKSWLAKKADISLKMVYAYLKGEFIPKPKTLEKIFKILNLPYKTIDDILEEAL